MAEDKDPKQNGKMKQIVLALLGVVLLGGVGVGAYLLGAKNGAAPAPQATAGQEGEVAEAASEEIGPLVDLDDFIVNLLDDEGNRYLKASVTLEMSNPDAVEEVEVRTAQIRDAILLLVGSKSFYEVRDLQGKLQLRADLLNRINSFLKNGQVVRIYFTDFVVQ